MLLHCSISLFFKLVDLLNFPIDYICQLFRAQKLFENKQL